MKKFLKILLIVITVIALFLAFAYLYIRFMPEKSVSKQNADYTVTASSLTVEYENNSSASDQKFIGRIIEVSGILSEITVDQNNSVVFILKDEKSTSGVLCTFTDESKKKTSAYKVGDLVKIKGTCSGMLFEVVLNKCVIIN